MPSRGLIQELFVDSFSTGPQLQPVVHGDGGGEPGQQGDHHVEARGLGAASQ